ncbi:MAG: apolipoprotein N-acyltransferase [Ilumatobacteraceae bacterium]|jgi:apolipoprotein N-acyltransferase
MSIRVPRFSTSAALALVAGLGVALSLPPWGFWPLAFVGIAMFETSLGEIVSPRSRAARGWLFAAAWMYPGLAWMWSLTAPGYLLAAAIFAGFHALAASVSPQGPWRVIGRPAAHTLAEALRLVFPFGGVPLATLPIGQAGGPLAGVVRFGGVILLTWVVFQIGFALSGPSPFVPQMARNRGRSNSGQWHGAIGFGVAIAVVVVGLAVAPTGTEAAQRSNLRVAIVQGGGPQGTRAIHSDSRQVMDRHLAATRTIRPGTVDLVVWPENVIDVAALAGSPELSEVTAEAARIGAAFAVGITEDARDNHFINAQAVIMPDGRIVSRYEKVHRVPFGEYMPMRGLLHALGAPTDLVPRDAVPGTGPAYLDIPVGKTSVRAAVVISWEVFFGNRAADGVAHGGTVILNPTNGSSYTGTILQSQQVASSRLRAIENGRWVVQVSPTGFSAFVSPDGDVLDRTSVSEQKVIIRTIDLNSGRTWYSHIRDTPFVVMMFLTFLASWIVPGRAWLARRRAAPMVTPETGVTPPTST